MRISGAALAFLVALGIGGPAQAAPHNAIASGSLKENDVNTREAVTIAGHPLGRPFIMRKCTKDKYGIVHYINIKNPCWTPKNGKVYWPFGTIPLGNTMRVTVDKGILTRVVFSTNGMDDQESVLDTLEDKFGKLTENKRTPIRNSFGAKYYESTVVWDKADVYVLFQSPDNLGIESGRVIVEMPAEHRIIRRRRKNLSQRNSRPPSVGRVSG